MARRLIAALLACALGLPAVAAEPTAPPAAKAPSREEKARAYFTDTVLYDQDGREVRFVSISVDPEFDTPQEMRRFAEKQEAAYTGWTWLTGKKEDVDRVLAKLGEVVASPGDHSTGFLAANVRTGHWTRIRPDASPAVVAQRVRDLADEDAKRGTEGATGPSASR